MWCLMCCMMVCVYCISSCCNFLFLCLLMLSSVGLLLVLYCCGISLIDVVNCFVELYWCVLFNFDINMLVVMGLMFGILSSCLLCLFLCNWESNLCLSWWICLFRYLKCVCRCLSMFISFGGNDFVFSMVGSCWIIVILCGKLMLNFNRNVWIWLIV